MQQRVRAVVEAFLPPTLRGTGGEGARQARVVVSVSLALAPLLGIVGLLSLGLRGPNVLGGVCVASAGSLFLTPPMVQKGVGRVASAWLLAVVTLGSSLTAWLGYGLMSPAVPTLVLVPIVALLVRGRAAGAWAAALVVAEIVVLFAAHRLGHVFPLQPDEALHIAYATVVLLTVLLCYVLVAIYDAAWRASEDRARAHAARLVESTEARQRFLADMSHELRTPLSAVLGYTELLLEEAPEHGEALGRVHQASTHLLSMADRLRHMERLAAGRWKMRREVVMLDRLLAEVSAEVRPIADRGANQLRVKAPPDLMLTTDRRALRQVLVHLASNACTFTRDGAVLLEVLPTSSFVRIDVRDTGVGMDAETVATLFEPRDDPEASLGLPNSRQLCEAMGGTLAAVSEPGRGTVFRVSLPR